MPIIVRTLTHSSLGIQFHVAHV